ncbi:MAG: hypothetical protein G01um101420_870 [Parcubacteria group bacterium Gr01-1014_20]|nr:MAG: hypothetical protein G01um101420_870 [Parcubacteria group bacterium Gr01-1014_20]
MNNNNQSIKYTKVFDIVCGMELDPAKIKGAVEYKRETYYFCSDSCRKHFVEKPERYTV